MEKRGKRFRTRKSVQNLRVWAMLVAVLLAVALIHALSTGQFTLLWVAVAISVIGALISIGRDRRKRCSYFIDDKSIMLRNWNESLTLELEDLMDASLLGRMAAREYITQRMRRAIDDGVNKERVREMRTFFIKYCSVDIGLTSASFGIGRDMTDRMPSVRDDLALLRMNNGNEILLSPIYAQDLISTINKALGRTKKDTQAKEPSKRTG